MKLFLRGHAYVYAATQMLLVLLPAHKPEITDSPPKKGEDAVISSLFHGEKLVSASCHASLGGKTVTAAARAHTPQEEMTQNERVRLEQRVIKQAIYRAICKLTGEIPPWGSLSGVRPSKLATRHLREGGTSASADRMLKEIYSVTPRRRRLCVEAAVQTRQAEDSLAPDELSLYIGIPFCPTRCSYCSFVSFSVVKSGKLLVPYLEALDKELEATAELVSRSGKKVRTIYIGGGTPTTLSTQQLSALVGRTRELFDLSRLTEYTVEGGRPDTLDEEKLRVLKDLGVTRVSVNPQTMRDEVLQHIGRSHTAAQAQEALAMARSMGFHTINADLIAGLPGDDLAGFCASLDKIIDFGPENITIHTLALKRGSDLSAQGGDIPSAVEVGRMLDFAESALRAAGYVPYYLYRQKYMAGSFENVGWTKPGRTCLYNICMMEELHTVLSCGGAGSTKVILPDGRLIRKTNPKFPLEYITNIEKAISDKRTLLL